jgi:hypothetical protein
MAPFFQDTMTRSKFPSLHVRMFGVQNLDMVLKGQIGAC